MCLDKLLEDLNWCKNNDSIYLHPQADMYYIFTDCFLETDLVVSLYTMQLTNNQEYLFSSGFC